MITDAVLAQVMFSHSLATFFSESQNPLAACAIIIMHAKGAAIKLPSKLLLGISAARSRRALQRKQLSEVFADFRGKKLFLF